MKQNVFLQTFIHFLYFIWGVCLIFFPFLFIFLYFMCSFCLLSTSMGWTRYNDLFVWTFLQGVQYLFIYFCSSRYFHYNYFTWNCSYSTVQNMLLLLWSYITREKCENRDILIFCTCFNNSWRLWISSLSLIHMDV